MLLLFAKSTLSLKKQGYVFIMNLGTELDLDFFYQISECYNVNDVWFVCEFFLCFFCFV